MMKTHAIEKDKGGNDICFLGWEIDDCQAPKTDANKKEKGGNGVFLGLGRGYCHTCKMKTTRRKEATMFVFCWEEKTRMHQRYKQEGGREGDDFVLLLGSCNLHAQNSQIRRRKEATMFIVLVGREDWDATKTNAKQEGEKETMFCCCWEDCNMPKIHTNEKEKGGTEFGPGGC